MYKGTKDGIYVNCYVARPIVEKLEAYCKQTGVPKTRVVEKALSQYLMQFELLLDNGSSTDKK